MEWDSKVYWVVGLSDNEGGCNQLNLISESDEVPEHISAGSGGSKYPSGTLL